MPTLVENPKAHFNYEILEKYEAGIELLGFEVKSLKKKQGNLEGAYILIRGGEAYMVGVLIPPYQEKNTPAGYDARRNRRLMLNRKEIRELAAKDGEKGLTIVPISIYNNGRLIKVTIAVVRGKKKYDKRETTKRREGDREMSRLMKGGR